ncbi:DnaT-like ssDNA-binding protein [uncultured Bilophila sp.]|uniref:DnaT-like ssDNA-binding protein n=1 Tax=uncultured Bilophila sp. TaxID=529385 RepID=UPI00266EEB9D|nr:DnaT-like ssDNA-binding protein [uncultured Bilophila sp.]
MLIIEDGTMPEGANSYVSLKDADDYLVLRGLWDATPEAEGESILSKKEAAIVRAFDALNTLNWVGDVPDWQRVTAWPRKNVPMPGANPKPGKEPEFLPADMVPRAVALAQMELAGLIYGGLNPLAPVERGGKVVSMSESTKEGDLDVIGGDSKSYSVTYSESAPVETYLPAVYGILGPYLREIPGKAGVSCGRVAMG